MVDTDSTFTHAGPAQVMLNGRSFGKDRSRYGLWAYERNKACYDAIDKCFSDIHKHDGRVVCVPVTGMNQYE